MFCKRECDWKKAFTDGATLTLGQIYGAEYSSELAYKTKERTRWKKAGKWMVSNATKPHLTLFFMLISVLASAVGVIVPKDAGLC